MSWLQDPFTFTLTAVVLCMAVVLGVGWIERKRDDDRAP